MASMEWIDKIVHGLISIKELSKANRHLAYSLKKELANNDDLRQKLFFVETELNSLRNKIQLDSYAKAVTSSSLPSPLQQMFSDECISISKKTKYDKKLEE